VEKVLNLRGSARQNWQQSFEENLDRIFFRKEKILDRNYPGLALDSRRVKLIGAVMRRLAFPSCRKRVKSVYFIVLVYGRTVCM
jgi:hypothetical protein